MQLIRQKKVIIFGVGGVGSWCVEALVRSGINDITMVDPDRVAQSNINRQLPATTTTVGQLKVEVMRRRMLEINPEANITAVAERYSESTSGMWDLADYDYVIDAIDSLADKAVLIINACAARPATLFSSMGAALKMDPGQIAVAEFWKVKGCPLAAALRQRFKRSGVYPSHKFKCVYSPEPRLANHADSTHTDRQRQPNGSIMHVTASFGLRLASLVLNDIHNARAK